MRKTISISIKLFPGRISESFVIFLHLINSVSFLSYLFLVQNSKWSWCERYSVGYWGEKYEFLSQLTCIQIPLQPLDQQLLLLLFSRQVMSDSLWPPPGFSVHGVLQARILDWVAISFSRGSSWTRDWTCVSCTGRWNLYHQGSLEQACFYKSPLLCVSLAVVREMQI